MKEQFNLRINNALRELEAAQYLANQLEDKTLTSGLMSIRKQLRNMKLEEFE